MGLLDSITSMAGGLGNLAQLASNPQLAELLKNPQVSQLLGDKNVTDLFKNIDASDINKVVDYIKQNGVPTDAQGVKKIIDIVTRD